jgi:tRNA threonylcarbamoyladenosine biosynthesis protein TsaB
MKTLAIETATGTQSVALLDGDRILAESHREASGHHGQFLMPAVDDLLKTTGCRLSEIESLAVSIGPGSFTGLRVGLATMMGFRMVTGAVMVTVPTLEAMAWNLQGFQGRLCPVLRGRTREVYWAVFEWHGERLQHIGPEQVGSLETFAASITDATIVYGEGWQTNREELRRLLGSSSHLAVDAPALATVASACSVALAACRRLSAGEIAGKGVSPRYIQRADAELMLERRTTDRSPGAPG